MLRRWSLLVSVLALCFASLTGVASAAAPTFTPGAPGIGDPYFPGDGNGGYDVGHYDLALTYDPATDQLTGVATITATATQNLSAFNLDFMGLNLHRVTVNGTTAATNRVDSELTVTPKHGITKGARFTVVAKYDGVPLTLEDFGLSGFIHTDDGAIAIGEPHVAATWFPANDHPRDKASFTIAISVPAGTEAISNGILKSQKTKNGSTTWTWDAKEPMATYLAFMAVGQFDVRSYKEDGLKYWDAIDSALMVDGPATTPVAGDQFLYSQIANATYKRLTRTIAVPAGGADMSFQVDRDTEPGWDFVFVEARTAGGDDWTTLPDANGHTSQDTGACPGPLFDNPFLQHYLTDVPPDLGDPDDPSDDVFFPCEPHGTSGDWNAVSGQSDGWETWAVHIPNTGASVKQVEISIAYVSDGAVQGHGAIIDDIAVSTGEGSTSFEADADVLDGWVAPVPKPDGGDNENTWTVTTEVAGVPALGPSVLKSFDRQPEILAFEAANFGPYPFSASGGVVDQVAVGFALENQTRPTYSPLFFDGGEGNDFVVVHELAHQWFGDNLAVDTWQNIWLNEGFATYAEWLWSEREGLGTAQENFDGWLGVPADDEFWDLAIGDPGPVRLFDFPVYARGALTLHALRVQVGDSAFFKILKEWTKQYAGGTVTTAEFIALAEKISHQDLQSLFDVWLSSGKPAGYAARSSVTRDSLLAPQKRSAGHSILSLRSLPAADRSLAERLVDRAGNPFNEAIKKKN